MYILLAPAVLHFCHLGKPLCWLDWIEGATPGPPRVTILCRL